jgi:hypothetical protein
LYAAILILLLLCTGLSAFWIADFQVAYPAVMFAFFVWGILHVYLLERWFKDLFDDGSWKLIGFTVLLGLVSALLMVLLYSKVLHSPGTGLGISTGLLVFLFPVFIIRLYQLFLMIPQREYKKWYYPVGQPLPDMDLLDLSSVLVIQFEFTKKAGEPAFTNFRAKAPNAMLFGELFFIFLNDYNDRNSGSPVEYLDADALPYGWLFYKKSPWYKRRIYMDPDLTFRANGITDNETIVAVRG